LKLYYTNDVVLCLALWTQNPVGQGLYCAELDVSVTQDTVMDHSRLRLFSLYYKV